MKRAETQVLKLNVLHRIAIIRLMPS